MADLYVASTGSNTAPYDTWAKAATTPLTATAAAAAGDTIYMHGESFTVAADATYVLADGVRWICTNDQANEPPQTLSQAGAILGTGAGGIDITINGVGLVYGVRFKVGYSTSTSFITVAGSDNDLITLDSCALDISGGNGTGSRIVLGNAASDFNAICNLRNTRVKFGSAFHGITSSCRAIWSDCAILDSGSTVPGSLFRDIARGGGSGSEFVGVDFSGMTSGTIFNPATITFPAKFVLSQCKLGAATLNGALTVTGLELMLYDCSSADTHYNLAHYAYNGSTTVSTAICADDGAEYDLAGDKCSWVVAGNANTNLANPYQSPWIARYNESTAATAPHLEILRNDSATAYSDTEVWGEWSVKTTSGSTCLLYTSDAADE